MAQKQPQPTTSTTRTSTKSRRRAQLTDRTIGKVAPANPSSEEVLRQMIAALARVRQVSVEEVEELVREGDGDLVIDSKEGETVIAILVGKFGCDLPEPADLKRDQFSSIKALLSLIKNKLLPKGNSRGNK